MSRYRHSGDPAWESADGDPEGYGDPLTPAQRKAARTKRRREAEQAAQEMANQTMMEDTLGTALTEALIRYLVGRPDRKEPLERAMATSTYSEELKQLIARSIELNPIMEPTFLKIAELAFEDGREAQREDNPYYSY